MEVKPDIEGEFRETGSQMRGVSRSALAVRVDEPVRALVTPEEAKAAWSDYERLKAAIASPDDFQEFYDKKSKKTRRFPKKSFVKKIQTFFGISVTTRDAVRDDLGDGHFAFRVVGVATAPNGRVSESIAACSTYEERFDLQKYDDESDNAFASRLRKALARSYHDVLSTAETRATGRAVMNLIGGGEVTAEEVTRERSITRSSARPAPAAEPDDVLDEYDQLPAHAPPRRSREDLLAEIKLVGTSDPLQWERDDFVAFTVKVTGKERGYTIEDYERILEAIRKTHAEVAEARRRSKVSLTSSEVPIGASAPTVGATA